MKIIAKNPTILWPIIKWRFPDADPNRIIIAFGDRVYTKGWMPQWKIVHEQVHLDQQHHSRIVAILRFPLILFSARFRLNQEIAAYKAEWRWIFLNVHDRELRAKMRHEMCIDLSSELYGNMISYADAMDLISRSWQ